MPLNFVSNVTYYICTYERWPKSGNLTSFIVANKHIFRVETKINQLCSLLKYLVYTNTVLPPPNPFLPFCLRMLLAANMKKVFQNRRRYLFTGLYPLFVYALEDPCRLHKTVFFTTGFSISAG